MNTTAVAESLYELLERVGVDFTADQAADLAKGLGELVAEMVAASRPASGSRAGLCPVCGCSMLVTACGHSCCCLGGSLPPMRLGGAR